MITDSKLNFMDFLVESRKLFEKVENERELLFYMGYDYNGNPFELMKENNIRRFNLEIPHKDLSDSKSIAIAPWQKDSFFYASSKEKLKIGFLVFSLIIVNYRSEKFVSKVIPYEFNDIEKEELKELFYQLFDVSIDKTITEWRNWTPWHNLISGGNPELHWTEIGNE